MTTDLRSATVTLGAQASREDDRTDKHILDMRRLLARHCPGPYSPEIREFALILRIVGEMQEFDFEGCDRIRRNKENKYITLDLAFLLAVGRARRMLRFVNTYSKLLKHACCVSLAAGERQGTDRFRQAR